MDTPSPAMRPTVKLERQTGLHDNDSRFVEEVIKVISSLNGSSTMKLKVHSKFATKFTLIILDPPRMNMDDMNQIFLMNSKIISIKTDLSDSQLRIEVLKHSESSEKKRKRVAYDEYDVPDGYDLSMVDGRDKKHIDGILRNLLGMTTMEFTSKIVPSPTHYMLEVEDIEVLDMEYMQEVVQKYRAFITTTIFDYPQKKLKINIRRNDTPITQIIAQRKKVKLIQ